jgi:hypothetical protein
MATDAQKSEPLVGENFTDRGWRAAFAGQTGIVGDSDGSAFGLTLPAEGATAELGSATLPSRLVVDGYGLEVAQGATQSLDIPASSGGGTNGRTDLIVARLDLSTFTGSPGPVRLDRVPGTEGSTALPAPTYDPDGVRDLPLYAIRRREGESLNQAIVTDLRPRIGHHYLVPSGGSMPAASLGDRATRGDVAYRYDLVGSSPDWVVEARPKTTLTGNDSTAGSGSNWQRQESCRLTRRLDGGRWLHLVSRRASGNITSNSSTGNVADVWVATLHADDKPPAGCVVQLHGRVKTTTGGHDSLAATGYIDPSDGRIYLNWMAPGITIGPDGESDTLTLEGWWDR